MQKEHNIESSASIRNNVENSISSPGKNNIGYGMSGTATSAANCINNSNSHTRNRSRTNMAGKGSRSSSSSSGGRGVAVLAGSSRAPCP